MAAYAQFGCGYPSANQFLNGGGGGGGASAFPTLASSHASTTSSHPSSQSPLTPNAPPSLSPSSNGRDSVARTLTPDPASQTSSELATIASVGVAGSTPAPLAGLVEGGGHDGTPCCDNGRPMATDPATGQAVCSCQYDPARLALASSYSRMQTAAGVGVGVGVGVYGTPYSANESSPYPSIGVDSGPFYSTLSNPYALKDSSNSADVTPWTPASLQPSASYYTYDPTFGAYGYGASYDLAARRKNATRESTATLKAWLNEHKKNPYPTKGEKIMLAIITKMTLTQVSTWFANARRRLKKENKMTWEPKNRTDDDDDDDPDGDAGGGGGGVGADGGDGEYETSPKESAGSADRSQATAAAGAAGGDAAAAAALGVGSMGVSVSGIGAPRRAELGGYYQPAAYPVGDLQPQQLPLPHHRQPEVAPPSAYDINGYDHHLKPKIWSIAETANGEAYSGGGGGDWRTLSPPPLPSAQTQPAPYYMHGTHAYLTPPPPPPLPPLPQSSSSLAVGDHYGRTSVVATISMQPTSPPAPLPPPPVAPSSAGALQPQLGVARPTYAAYEGAASDAASACGQRCRGEYCA